MYRCTYLSLSLLLIIGIFLFQAIFSWVLGDKVIVEIHDNLDSTIGWLKLLKDNHLFFSSGDTLVPIMDGIPRRNFMSELQLTNFLYFVFSPLIAYNITYSLKLIFGFLSFYLFTSFLLDIKKYEKNWILILCSGMYALLPGYPNLYIAQATIPLILYLIFFYIKKPSSLILVCIFFYPLLSEFPRYGMFILAILGIYSALLLLKKESVLFRRVILVTCILLLGYLITDYRIFSLILSGDSTIREEYIVQSKPFMETFISALLNGQYHAASLHTIPLFSFLIFCTYCIFQTVFGGASKCINDKRVVRIFGIFLLILTNIYIYTLYYCFPGVRELIHRIPMLDGWNYSRFIWFNPLLWYLMFYLVLDMAVGAIKKVLIFLLLISQLLVIIVTPSYGNEIAKNIQCSIFDKCDNKWSSYKDFYDVSLFDKAKKTLSYQGEPVTAFGFHPSILSYNGFYTLDGYHNIYPLSYKKEFRKLIEPALNSSQQKTRYFDEWGARAYIFSSTISQLHNNESGAESVLLEMDLQQAIKMGLVYIISKYPLDNSLNSFVQMHIPEIEGTLKEYFFYKIKYENNNSEN